MISTVIKNKIESPLIHTIFFDRTINCNPGQFMMIWLPRLGEKPFTLSYSNAITVKKVGTFTEQLIKLRLGDKIGLRVNLVQQLTPMVVQKVN